MIESPFHSRIDAAAPFAWACPVCRTDLAVQDASAGCPACDTVYACQDAIWRFLAPSRQAVFAKFLREYKLIRRREGWGHTDAHYYRALPTVARRDPNRAVWRLRARSFQVVEQQIVHPLERRHPRPLKLLDLGAGNGWLAHHLARRGHRVAAVDLQTNAFDGLGAHVYYDAAFTPVQAEFDRLPFANNQFDLAIFNGALHYATDYATTLTEALRVLRPDGQLVVLDSPVYHDAHSGAQRVREREARFRQTYGFPSDALPCEHFLTWARLDTLATTLNVSWRAFTPPPDWRWTLRGLLARLRTGREPASFPILLGSRSERIHGIPSRFGLTEQDARAPVFWCSSVPVFQEDSNTQSAGAVLPPSKADVIVRDALTMLTETVHTLRQQWKRLRSALRRDHLPVLTPRHGYDRWAASYGENMNPVQVLEGQAMQRLLPDLRDRVVLDVGCGKGRLARLALERGARQTVGVDLSEAMLTAAAEAMPSLKAHWVHGDVQTLPLKAASFDVVLSGLMMGHVADLNAALDEIARILRPGGVLVLSDFHPYATLRGWQRTFIDAESGHTYAIANHLHLLEDYVRGFTKQGLELEALEEPCYEGYPLVFVLRARKA